MSSPTRRAFSLPEVAVGLVVLMIVAGLATVALSSTSANLEDRLLSSSAQLFDETYRARLTYDLSLEISGEAAAAARAELAASAVSSDVTVVTSATNASFSRGDAAVCLTYATAPDTPGVVTTGPC